MCVLTSPILYCPTQEVLGELLVFGMVLNASLSIILFFTQAIIWFFFFQLFKRSLPPISSLSPISSRPRSKQLLRTQAPISAATGGQHLSREPLSRNCPHKRPTWNQESLHQWRRDATSWWGHPEPFPLQSSLKGSATKGSAEALTVTAFSPASLSAESYPFHSYTVFILWFLPSKRPACKSPYQSGFSRESELKPKSPLSVVWSSGAELPADELGVGPQVKPQ